MKQLVHLVTVYLYSQILIVYINGCSTNFLKPNFSKNGIIRKTNVLGNPFISRADPTRDLGAHVVCKLHYRRNVDFIFAFM